MKRNMEIEDIGQIYISMRKKKIFFSTYGSRGQMKQSISYKTIYFKPRLVYSYVNNVTV